MTNKTARWRFPKIEGIIVNEKTGVWSDAAFHNEFLDDDDQLPVVWHQAAPGDDVTDIAAWRRWKKYLETNQDAGETLRMVALAEAWAKVEKLVSSRQMRRGVRS